MATLAPFFVGPFLGPTLVIPGESRQASGKRPMRDRSLTGIYMLTGRRRGTRFAQHREGLIPGFTKRYGVHRLVCHEAHETMEFAILRDKRIKGWRRAWTIDLIQTHNEEWGDLAIGLGLPRLSPASAGVTRD